MRAWVSWQASPEQMANQAEGFYSRLLDAVQQVGQQGADEIVSDAQATHKWANRTGAAEAGIWGRAETTDSGVRIYVGHGVHYGIYLERRWGGRYAGVVPALQRGGPKIMARIQQMIG
jgi:hypothetical protein